MHVSAFMGIRWEVYERVVLENKAKHQHCKMIMKKQHSDPLAKITGWAYGRKGDETVSREAKLKKKFTLVTLPRKNMEGEIRKENA